MHLNISIYLHALLSSYIKNSVLLYFIIYFNAETCAFEHSNEDKNYMQNNLSYNYIEREKPEGIYHSPFLASYKCFCCQFF